MLLIQSTDALEDSLPHTRANAIVLPKRFHSRGQAVLERVLSHEAFHVLTRNNGEMKEKLYAAIGFRRCETVTISPAVSRLRITNPDAVENRHTIAVRYRGEPVEALPYVRFASDKIDPRAGFVKQAEVAWLLIDRHGGECRARTGAVEAGVTPAELDGLLEQVGRNSTYLIHPEEILADNFSHLFELWARAAAPDFPSPEILQQMRRILFE